MNDNKIAEALDIIEIYVAAFNMLNNVDYLSNTSVTKMLATREKLLNHTISVLIDKYKLSKASDLIVDLLPIRIEVDMVVDILT